MKLETLIRIHRRRSPRSIAMDENINARKQFRASNKKGVEYWKKYPAQCDIIGVDNIRKPHKHKKTKPKVNRRVKPKVVRKRKKTKPKAVLTITHKSPLRKANVGLSKSRKMQLKMKLTDPYEKKMVERIRRKSGLTHIQAVNLFKKSRDSDFDVEFGLDYDKGHGDRRERYQFLSDSIEKKKDPLKRSIRDLMADYY